MKIERHPNGKFAPGNRGGPGRPTREAEEQYLARLSTEVSMEDWIQITRRAIEDAKDGDWRARNWLSDYLMGKPGTTGIQDNRSIVFDFSNLSNEQLDELLHRARIESREGEEKSS